MHFTNLAQKDRKLFSWDRPGERLSRPSVRRECRRLNPADFGLDVTIAIVARSDPNGIFVSASDRMLSFDDAVPAIDNATFKDVFFSRKWKFAFTANDTAYVIPIILRATDLLIARGKSQRPDDMRKAMCDAFSGILKEQAAREHLTKFGFSSVDDFMKAGPSNLGRRLFWSLAERSISSILAFV